MSSQASSHSGNPASGGDTETPDTTNTSVQAQASEQPSTVLLSTAPGAAVAPLLNQMTSLPVGQQSEDFSSIIGMALAPIDLGALQHDPTAPPQAQVHPLPAAHQQQPQLHIPPHFPALAPPNVFSLPPPDYSALDFANHASRERQRSRGHRDATGEGYSGIQMNLQPIGVGLLEGLDARSMEDFEREVEQLEWMGTGRHHVVYKGRMREGGRRVAIRREVEGALPGAASRMTIREARMMLGLDCDSIVKVEAIYGDDEGIIVLLEYGVGDLRSGMRGQLVGFQVPDTPRAMCKLVQQLADPLLYLHSFQQKTAEDKLERNPILHRDIKPDNYVGVEKEGGPLTWKLTDFGEARHLHGQGEEERPRTHVGTDAYMAPEVDEKETGHTDCADVFSFGVVIWEVLTGLEPEALQEVVQSENADLRATLKEQVKAAVQGWPEGDVVAESSFVDDMVDFIDTALTRPYTRRPHLRTLLASSSLLHGRLSTDDESLAPTQGAVYEAWVLIKDKLKHEYDGKIDNLLHAVTSAGRLKSFDVLSERERIFHFLRREKIKPEGARADRATEKKSQDLHRLLLAIALVLAD